MMLYTPGCDLTLFQAIVIAIVQGITEFLPISSTGHMILVERLLGVQLTDFTKAYIVNIQLGSILSVLVLYWKRFFQTFRFYFVLFVAFMPAVILGLLFGNYIEMLLGNVLVVGVSLLLGGIVLIFVDRWFKNERTDQKISYKDAIKIGLFQCIAMIPGVSRSAATIVGGMSQKLSRKNAAEFSFFLAVPTLFGASVYELYKNFHVINNENLSILFVGNFVSFIVALIAIKGFIAFLTKQGFKLFGYYRILIGLIILTLFILGYDLNF